MRVRSLRTLIGTLLLIGALGASISTKASAGEPLALPSGPVILTVTGSIEHSNVKTGAQFDFAMLSALPSRRITTETKWTDGQITFEGPLLREVLKRVGAAGNTLNGVAINDYKVKIPVSDAEKHDVILAHTANGKRMRIRDKGPLWVIYPWSEHPKLKDESIYSRSIWQLKLIDVE